MNKMIFVDLTDLDSVEDYKKELRELSKSMLKFMLIDKKESISYLETKIEIIKQIINEKRIQENELQNK